MSEVRDYFNSLAENWDNMCSHDPDKLRTIVTLAGISQGSKVLDIACGTGVLFEELLRCNPAQIVGIDISDKMIAEAKKKYSDPRLTFFAEDLFSFEEQGFDVAMIYSAYPHFEDKKRLCNHVCSLLKQGGRLLIAHSQSKEAINGRHSGSAKDVSSCLQGTKIEKQHFIDCFDMDIEVDTEAFYILSGTKR